MLAMTAYSHNIRTLVFQLITNYAAAVTTGTCNDAMAASSTVDAAIGVTPAVSSQRSPSPQSPSYVFPQSHRRRSQHYACYREDRCRCNRHNNGCSMWAHHRRALSLRQVSGLSTLPTYVGLRRSQVPGVTAGSNITAFAI